MVSRSVGWYDIGKYCQRQQQEEQSTRERISERKIENSRCYIRDIDHETYVPLNNIKGATYYRSIKEHQKFSCGKSSYHSTSLSETRPTAERTVAAKVEANYPDLNGQIDHEDNFQEQKRDSHWTTSSVIL